MSRKPQDAPVEDIQAGDAFRRTLYDTADTFDATGAPMWYGWALMDAFLAGAEYARKSEARSR